MMVEKSAKTVEAAVKAALKELNITEEMALIEIFEGERTLFFIKK